jgi:hypothetical protein
MEQMIDGTLFKALYDAHRASYKITSRTPVDGCEPLVLTKWIDRIEATTHREKNWPKGLSIDTSALALGIEALQPQIAPALRKLREGELVQAELEGLEGFGSF